MPSVTRDALGQSEETTILSRFHPCGFTGNQALEPPLDASQGEDQRGGRWKAEEELDPKHSNEESRFPSYSLTCYTTTHGPTKLS